ncbi:MAG: sulfite exporter TauE/SafE-domain-containing protein [Monoraphidium minutum]|nr:MAG: sulfite exporter TauE/SafE-domain-containing protein [Monoraphidium minutum]
MWGSMWAVLLLVVPAASAGRLALHNTSLPEPRASVWEEWVPLVEAREPAGWTLACALTGTDSHALGFHDAGGGAGPTSAAAPLGGSTAARAEHGADAAAPAAPPDADAGAAAGGAAARPHKPLRPLSPRDAALFAAVLATAALAAGGGIGGGALFVPLFVTLGAFATSQAVALSNLAILGSAAANVVINARRPHPRAPGRPLIDWSLILIMEPLTVLGALLLPSVVTVTLLTLLLTLLTLQLFRRGLRTYRAESKEAAATKEAEARGGGAGRRAGGGAAGGERWQQLAQPLLQQPGAADGGDLPQQQQQQQQQHVLSHAGGAGDNIRYTPRNTLLYPVLCSAAGLVAGLFGLGGGVVKAPLMLELGVLADVAAATSTTMILFTSASACIVYANFGLIPSDYGVVVAALGLAGTVLGQWATTRAVKGLQRRSIIIFLMVTMMALASATAFIHAVVRWRDVAHGDTTPWEWGHICKRSSA